MLPAPEADYGHHKFLGPHAPVLAQSQYRIRDPKRPSLLQSCPAQDDDDGEDVEVDGCAATTSQQAANGARHRESTDMKDTRRSGRLWLRKQSRRPKKAREGKRRKKS